MTTACDVIYWEILPAVRRELARALVAKGVPKSRAARAIGVTPAALSQYLHGKRGMRELPQWIIDRIRKYVETMECVNVCEICAEIRRDPRFYDLVPDARGCARA